MIEELAQKIMAIYLEKEWGVKLKPRKSGPDFLHKGKAIEVKGSDFKVSDATLQFARYAHEYVEFGIAFPADALSGRNLIQFHFLSKIWYTMFSKFLTIYLIREQRMKYGVLRMYDASDLIRKVCEEFGRGNIWKERDMPELLKHVDTAIKSFNSATRRAAKSVVDEDYSTTWLFKS